MILLVARMIFLRELMGFLVVWRVTTCYPHDRSCSPLNGQSFPKLPRKSEPGIQWRLRRRLGGGIELPAASSARALFNTKDSSHGPRFGTAILYSAGGGGQTDS